jgi:rSAM/selenodomain-associated transferase 1
LKETIKKNALIIFIKNPQLGRVKTRLAQTVGNENALSIYQQLLSITRMVALSLNEEVALHLFYSDFINDSDEFDNQLFIKHLQLGNDLGERMQNAFQTVFETAENAIIIGSDCPMITPDLLRNGFNRLHTYIYVLGACEDGGYYLMGMQKHCFLKDKSFFVFENINWSTSSVYADTVTRLKKRNLSLYDLPTLFDIDTEADWNRYLMLSTVF